MVLRAILILGCAGLSCELYNPIECAPCTQSCPGGFACVQGSCVAPGRSCDLQKSCSEGLIAIGGDCQGPLQMDIGRHHACAVWADGRVSCWGSSFAGETGTLSRVVPRPIFVEGISNALEVATTWYQSCARTADNRVFCWGVNHRDILGPGGAHLKLSAAPIEIPLPADFVPVGMKASDIGVCLSDVRGALYCFGGHAWGLEPHFEPGPFDAIAMGWGHLCALQEGSVHCFGENNRGELNLDGLRSVSRIAAGTDSTCVIQDGNLLCAGQSVYAPPQGTGPYEELDANTYQACARSSSGVRCWGHLLPVFSLSGEPFEVSPDFRSALDSAHQVVVGGFAACVHKARQAPLCWGTLGSALLTEPHLDKVGGPYTPLHQDVVEVSSGAIHSCARLSSGRVLCWGLAQDGRLGAGQSGPNGVAPTELADLSAQRVVAGQDHTCAIDDADQVLCWGSNHARQSVPTSSVEVIDRPERVSDLGPVTQLSAGRNSTCVLDDAGVVTCWGSNATGQLGESGSIKIGRPQGLPPLKEIAAGEHTCGLDLLGRAWCWGRNDRGQASGSAASATIAPSLIPGVSGAVEVTVGDTHTCARLADGRVMCWGDNRSGKIGDGSLGGLKPPTLVKELDDAISLDAGPFHTCAVRGDGTVVCWGEEDLARFGEDRVAGTLESGRAAPEPLQIQGIQGAQKVVVAQPYACALVGDRIDCWGQEAWGSASGIPQRLETVERIRAPRVP